ncbi:MAG: hypothetical protein U0487_03355 [Patescibacteria group bacterium]
MSDLGAQRHEWDERPTRDNDTLRVCKRCQVEDYRRGTRYRVQWPCIVAQETWTLEDTKAALLASTMLFRYVDMLVVVVKDGKHYAGLRVPDAGKYGLSLYPAKSQGTLYAGKALSLFFNWALSLGFDLDTDAVLQQRLTSKTGS